MDTICFAKIKPNARIPSKRDEDGCYDIYACFDEDSICIWPNEIKLIPTGIASVFDSKYRISVRERGTNSKTGLDIKSGQIDSGYRGEYFISVRNANDKPLIISKSVSEMIEDDFGKKVPYDKAIGQLALEIVPKVEVKEITLLELLGHKSERMDGKLGSSNK